MATVEEPIPQYEIDHFRRRAMEQCQEQLSMIFAVLDGMLNGKLQFQASKIEDLRYQLAQLFAQFVQQTPIQLMPEQIRSRICDSCRAQTVRQTDLDYQNVRLKHVGLRVPGEDG